MYNPLNQRLAELILRLQEWQFARSKFAEVAEVVGLWSLAELLGIKELALEVGLVVMLRLFSLQRKSAHHRLSQWAQEVQELRWLLPEPQAAQLLLVLAALQ